MATSGRLGDTFPQALVHAVPQTPYDSVELRQSINSNRAQLGGTLFFDSLASELAHISNGK